MATSMNSVFPNRIKSRLNPNPPKPKIQLPRHEIIRRGHTDYAILHHAQVIKNLLQLEKRYYDSISSSKIFGVQKSINPVSGKQTDIQPWMRKTVVSWLLEVCEELQMETEVYFVAVNMMDRMTMKLFFKREHFQLLAAASLLIASKLKETLPIQPDKVIIYTDNSISFEDLIRMEQIILSELVWDVSSPTPVDFIDILCHKLADPFSIDMRTTMKIKSLALCIAQQTSIEHHFIGVRPSKIACASAILACHEYLPPVATEANKLNNQLQKSTKNPFSITPPNKLSPDKGYSTTSSVSSAEVTPDNFGEKYPGSDLGSSSNSLNSETNFVGQNQYIPNNQNIPNNYYFASSNQYVNAPVNRQLWDIPQNLEIDSSHENHQNGQNTQNHQNHQNPSNQNVQQSSAQHSRSGSFSSNSSGCSISNNRLSLRLKIQYKPRTTAQILDKIRETVHEQFTGVRNVIKKIGETGIHKVPVEEILPPPVKTKPRRSSIFDQFKPNNSRLSLPPNYFSTGLSQQVKHNLSPPEPIGSRKSKIKETENSIENQGEHDFVQPRDYSKKQQYDNQNQQNQIQNQTQNMTQKQAQTQNQALQTSKSTDFQPPLKPLKRQHTSSSSQVLSNTSGNSCSSAFLEPQSNFVNEIENIESILRGLLPDNLNTSSDMFL